ncbi:MAG: Clp protease ClpP [Rikenellaceae bacterium]
MENIRIQNALDICVIDIEGTIGVPEEWQFEEPQQRVATYEKFRAAVARIEELEAEQVVVNIRSTGGDVNDALLIYEALSSIEAQITTRCYGYVASAATVIAQAATQGKRMISANSLYLIHNSSCSAEGNAEELGAKVELLRKTDEQLANLYARHGGLSVEEYTALMASESGKGTWLSALETIEAGLADSIIDVSSIESDEKEPTEQEEQQSEELEQTEEEVIGGVKAIFRKLTRQFGIGDKRTPERVVGLPKCGHNILHEPDKSQVSALSIIELEEGQKGIGASKVASKEDASLSEATLSANEMAYRNDIQRLMR